MTAANVTIELTSRYNPNHSREINLSGRRKPVGIRSHFCVTWYARDRCGRIADATTGSSNCSDSGETDYRVRGLMRKLRVTKDRPFHTSLGVLAVRFWELLILVALVFPILTSLCLAAAEPGPNAKNVLVLFTGDGGEHNNEFLNTVESTVRARISVPVNFFVSSLVYPVSEDKSTWGTLAETLRGQYSGVKLDVVIVSCLLALQFAAEYRDKLFPGVPIVFIAITDRELREQSKWPDVTGVTVPVGLRETIDLALRLHPDTQTLAIVTGPSFSSNYWLAAAHAELLRYQDHVKEIDILGPTNQEMIERIAALPPHTVALFSLSPDTVNQPAFGGWDVLSALAKRVPTYSAWLALCHYGCIGGA